MAVHDADDISVKKRLDEQYDYMEQNPEIGVVFSNLVVVNEK